MSDTAGVAVAAEASSPAASSSNSGATDDEADEEIHLTTPVAGEATFTTAGSLFTVKF